MARRSCLLVRALRSRVGAGKYIHIDIYFQGRPVAYIEKNNAGAHVNLGRTAAELSIDYMHIINFWERELGRLNNGQSVSGAREGWRERELRYL